MPDWQIDDTMGDAGWWVKPIDYNCALGVAVAVRHRTTHELRRQVAIVEGPAAPVVAGLSERAGRRALHEWIDALNRDDAVLPQEPIRLRL